MAVAAMFLPALLSALLAAAAPPGPSVALTFDDATDDVRVNAGILKALAGAGVGGILFVAGGMWIRRPGWPRCAPGGALATW